MRWQGWGTILKQLMEYIFELGNLLFRVNTSYPCDHIAVQLDRVGDYDKLFKNYLFPLDKITGKRIDLEFKADANSAYTVN